MDYILIAAGLVGLFLGGEALVRGAIAIAARLCLPPLLIGLTVVGFGTSMPEMLVSVDAAMKGVPDIAVGNIVGSNIGNILLIVGVSALIWPIRVAAGTLGRDTTVMMLATLALIVPFWAGSIGFIYGVALLSGLVAYLIWAYRSSDSEAAEDVEITIMPLWRAGLWVAGGLLALMFGARFLVDGAVNIARAHGVSEAYIGLTIVAIGTSLPELATSLVAALRRQSEIAIGNIVGSNIFNILGILGVTAILSPIPVANRFLRFDLPVLIVVTATLTALLLTRPTIGRKTGMALLTGYGAYLWLAQG
ncbi:calcium/sodium antiporter [Pseudoprimorskyibacter insulae]|uniref:Inner membrane protein YrbG n=1 Tax=Pseudoprimorskyibacter insulae TaxID=1695997 RepID=A0A2R8AR51_9RHOB|nr:calcium/sodium antiporter [Pseudoprimorskyibacter insulae]SPF78505.1 Inner membrane protein YrbG [Pseudoprimorskyibacter insulae]